METRKRPHGEEDELLHPKKRTAIDSNGSPSHVNGLAHPDEPKDTDHLEMFRKEAIFRRMRHYSRETERSQLRIAELERRKNTCEAGLAAVEACWAQLINVIRSLVNPDDLPPEAETRDIFDIATYVTGDSDSRPTLDLAGALKSKLDSTEELISAFVRMSGRSQADSSQDDLYSECQKAKTECTVLRSEMTLMRSTLSGMIAQKDKYLADLVAAESRIDRLQSKTIPAVQASPRVNGDHDEATPDVKSKDEEEEVKREKPLSPSLDQAPMPNHFLADIEVLQNTIKSQEEEIAGLQAKIESLRDQVIELEKEHIVPSEEFVGKSLHYKILLDHASKLEYEVKSRDEELAKVNKELSDLYSNQKDFEDSIRVTKEYEVTEVLTKLKKRDVENVRLRDQRDQLIVESHERKLIESVKIHSTQELKTLSESRAERILVMQSELRRLRAQLAVNTRDEDLMKFILRMTSADISYVDDLKTRLATSEAKVAALEESLSNLKEGNSDVAQHIEAEAQVRQLLIETTKRLETYQNVYGQSSLTPDVQVLSEELKKKEEELERLRLQDMRHVQAETSLYAELDKLSSAWESLDRQNKSKIFDLTAMEDRLTKSALDKAKSENKFYSAMRDKEATENERKNLMRNVEKQAKAVEKLLASEKSLQGQVNDRDRTLHLLQKGKNVLAAQMKDIVAERNEWQTRAEGEGRKLVDLGQKWSEEAKLNDRLKSDIYKLETTVTRINKDLEKQAKLKVAQSAPSSVKEAQLQSEVEKCMSILKCSTCSLNMRNTVITKCMHSFCKQCIDTRISTRQRKCPACNLPFAQSDVQQLYFQ